MKKIKLIIALLLFCSLLGCGNNTPEPNPDKSKETIAADKKTNDVSTTEVETSTQDDTITETVSSHPINQNNLEDMMGLWSSSDGWSLLIIASDNSQFPNIGLCSLYKDSVFQDMSMDESGRINENTIQLCQVNGTPLNAQITFTEEGILLSDILDINFKETLFTRPGLYSNSAENLGDTCYSGTDALYVYDQYIGNQMTYLILMNVVTGENWIACYDGALTESFENTYLVPEKVDYYPQSYLKGFPGCVLYNPLSLTETEYYNYLSGGNQSYGNGYYDGNSYTGTYDDTPSYTTPECDFPLEYTESFYFPEHDVWVVTYVDKGESLFEITDVDVLAMDDNTLQIVPQVRNNGEKPYVIYAFTTYHDKYGYKDDELSDTDVMTSLYIPSDQAYPNEDVTETYLTEHGMRFGIPAGREGYLFFWTADGDALTNKTDLSEVEVETRYIYIKINDYARTEY